MVFPHFGGRSSITEATAGRNGAIHYLLLGKVSYDCSVQAVISGSQFINGSHHEKEMFLLGWSM
ncbi:hypothetical protein L917_08839 [Phytophthora nicotianae]|uniref:Uncharacterized protein n=1 Tax=Phytophthora nicotianae TaxID=4792 RepID=W2L7Z0_PHYNI|nr:hypothetical protein L915_08992 [Phytophthora nicotianae]ETL92914.1 hypothetical protein L917_08839 [Phytophthora nicotianae]